jgi:dihydroorotate dehydrogenase electron transfer subunit
MQNFKSTVLEHSEFGGDYRLIVFRAPDIARASAPGQFVHMQIPGLGQVALRRPFSIYKVTDETLSVMYKPVGRGTQALADVEAGQEVSLIGPLGQGFPLTDTSYPVLIAGGYGVAPLSFYAERCSMKGSVFIGGKGEVDILCVEDFEAYGWDIHIATEDGSRGSKGLVTDALDAWLEPNIRGPNGEDLELFACGPEGLMHAAGERISGLGAQGWLSFDRNMGCGIGACLACVQKVRDDSGTVTWQRCCREGPVFDASKIVWDD